MKTVFLTDFDGTVSQDILLTMFKKYANHHWEEWVERYRRGEIGSRQLHQEVTPSMRVTKYELQKYLYYHCFIDPYFNTFVDYCSQMNIPMAIVSDGLDIYIHQMMENAGITGIPVFSNFASFDGDRLTVAFPPRPEACPCGSCASCKRAVCWKYRDTYPDRKLVYAGDGLSDIKVLSEVDIIFAKDKLAAYCRENNIDFKPFANFADIHKEMKLLT